MSSIVEVNPINEKVFVDGCLRILVTGGSGFIGTNLIEFYSNKSGISLLNLDIISPRNVAHEKFFANVDLRDEDALENVILKFRPQWVFHLGARTDLEGRSLQDYAANTTGVLNLISVLKKLEVPPMRVLFASSRLVCKIGYSPVDEFDVCPTTYYGESKALGEKLVRDNVNGAFEWIIFRPTSIWGPWFAVPYRTFFDAIQHRRYVHPRGRKIYKSFGFVGNAIFQLDCLINITANEALTKTVYLCDYEPVEVFDWANRIARKFGCAPPVSIPLLALRLVARLGDVYQWSSGRPAPLTTFRLENLVTDMIHENSVVSKLVGPLPFSLDESVSLTCDWMKYHVI